MCLHIKFLKSPNPNPINPHKGISAEFLVIMDNILPPIPPKIVYLILSLPKETQMHLRHTPWGVSQYLII